VPDDPLPKTNFCIICASITIPSLWKVSQEDEAEQTDPSIYSKYSVKANMIALF
jgi:hypothetical protein